MTTPNIERAVIVTGASSGIGRAIAEQLGKAGFRLWLLGRSAEGLAATADSIKAAGGLAPHCEIIDIQEAGRLAGLVEKIGQTHPYLFALVNNAGVMHPESILSGTPARWRAMFEINVLAPLEACRTAIEAMRRHGQPAHLINISSIAAQWEDGGVYGASKRALETISGTLRLELEHDDIRVATIAPGGFTTQLGRHLETETIRKISASIRSKGIEPSATDKRLMGDPNYIAHAVLYILEQPININIEKLVIRPPIDTRC
ncbi:SDR family oxidoreductase [Ferribacterium limneticum]|uniref:SDR family oxidoreductase n=1 Tax=Ferribacterium limneticum TaxID=76259 RepID=UPI001CF86F6F|nr:SDR family NAD(P)-dependent oxidoreductase [Ferribacterium limneticum]UCV23613.1 SDR family NAD(P)-dependent oxidoreductase [Ferribacterium limneticum]